jgi:hypothetical protein
MAHYPRFQDCAFDPDLGRKRGIGELRKFFDGAELGGSGFAQGFQIKRFRTGYKKPMPRWVLTNKGIQKVLLSAFPRLQADANQRKRAGRWAQAINLYYKLNWSAFQVAEELGYKTRDPIDSLVLRMKHVSQGLTVNGLPRRRNKRQHSSVL